MRRLRYTFCELLHSFTAQMEHVYIAGFFAVLYYSTDCLAKQLYRSVANGELLAFIIYQKEYLLFQHIFPE
jgi:hypothetical protein